jgi:hypothetical protein
MATMADLKQRLLGRFKDVPEVSDEDVTEWLDTALNDNGFTSSDDVPADKVSLVLLNAQAEGASTIALSTAHYFSFTDKDQTVDKSGISERYRTLADELWDRYQRKKTESNGAKGAKFRVMRRLDR